MKFRIGDSVKIMPDPLDYRSHVYINRVGVIKKINYKYVLSIGRAIPSSAKVWFKGRPKLKSCTFDIGRLKPLSPMEILAFEC